MTNRHLGIVGFVGVLLVFSALLLNGAEPVGTGVDAQLKVKAEASMKKAATYLLERQQRNGSWCENPGITGLVCMALHKSGIKDKDTAEAVNKGRVYILRFAQSDGSIWPAGSRRGFPVYNTSIALAALAVLGHPEDEDVMRKARAFLYSCQLTEGNKKHPTPEDSDLYGGFSYGGDGPPHADMSNTQWALEALYLTDYLAREPKAKSSAAQKQSELSWSAALKFMTKLQECPETNDSKWVVQDPDSPEHGGFVYVTPKKAEGGKKKDGSLRSYGSMTYAGLKSMIYAKVTKDDSRVKAAVEWTQRHYTVAENPGQGVSGLYYYLQTFAKANSVFGRNTITSNDGKVHYWRRDLLEKLISLQKKDGEWLNESGRWMESVPELVTSYSLLAMSGALAGGK